MPVVLSLSQATKDENKRIKALERDPQRKEKALAAAAALLVLTTKAEAIPRGRSGRMISAPDRHRAVALIDEATAAAGHPRTGAAINTPADHRHRQPGNFRPALSGNFQAALTRSVAASIFRLGFFIICSVYHDGADLAPIKPMVPKSGSISNRARQRSGLSYWSAFASQNTMPQPRPSDGGWPQRSLRARRHNVTLCPKYRLL